MSILTFHMTNDNFVFGPNKTIGIIGSRRRDTKEDFELTRNMFNKIYVSGDRICSGLCPKGGDWFAVLIALKRDWIEDYKTREIIYQTIIKGGHLRYYIQPIWYPADWKKHGRAAGLVRNTDIAKDSDILIATPSLDRTGGTEDTIKKFKKFHGEGGLKLV